MGRLINEQEKKRLHGAFVDFLAALFFLDYCVFDMGANSQKHWPNIVWHSIPEADIKVIDQHSPL